MIQIDMDMPKTCVECDLLMEDPHRIDGYCAKTKHTVPNSSAIRGRNSGCPLAPALAGVWKKGKMWDEGFGMGESYGYYYTCSVCGHRVRGGYTSCGYRFCSSCGSRNEEE